MIAFVDCETTSLTPHGADGGAAWEVAVVVDEGTRAVERSWQVALPDAVIARAQPQALAVGRYRTRFDRARAAPEAEVARGVVDLLAGAVLAGVCPWFDAAFLGAMLGRHGHAVPWDWHVVDVLAYGAGAARLDPPWKSGTVAAALGVARDKDAAHTALGDARFARDLYRAAVAARRLVAVPAARAAGA